MKIMTILGTRPEIIRLSIIMRELDEACDHVTVWTGQNWHPRLKDIFLEEFEVRKFDYDFQKSANTSRVYKNLAYMIEKIGEAIQAQQPDKILILGDTNSSLAAAVVGERMGVPVYHMEAGNRCYDMKVPEEKNRIMIDSISSFNLPYVENSRENLLQSGYPKNRIFKCGNPIGQVIEERCLPDLGKFFADLEILRNQYILVTAHRSENVDNPNRLLNIMDALKKISKIKKFPIVFSVHPRTQEKLNGLQYEFDNLKICKPFNFTEFIALERSAYCIITDSGTVQEEASIFWKPCVIIRDSTERPETLEAGSHIVSGLETDRIVECFKRITAHVQEQFCPDGYDDRAVSDKVINFLLGNQL